MKICSDSGPSVGLWKERIESSPGSGVFLLEIAFPLASFAVISTTTVVRPDGGDPGVAQGHALFL